MLYIIIIAYSLAVIPGPQKPVSSSLRVFSSGGANQFLKGPAEEKGFLGQYPNSVLTPSDGVDTKKAILDKARETLEKHFNSDTYRFRISARWIPRSVLRIGPKDIQSVELEGGVKRYTNFTVVFQTRNVKKRTQIQLAVDTERKLPVPKRRIASGEVIEEKDINVRWISISHNRTQLVSEASRLVGKTLRQTLLPGQPVPQTGIGGEYVIKAGETVTLILVNNGIQVQLKAEARQNGAKNDEIRIYSDETRKKYLGKVVSPGAVKWKKTLY